MIVNLHIERLVIEGLPVGRHQGPLVEAAVTAELERLIGESGFAGRLEGRRSEALVSAEPITRPARDGTDLGTQIGRAVFEGLGR